MSIVTSSMHRCLRISEIQHEICDGIDHKDRSALVSLATSCKALFMPAMAALWYRQDGLIPLIRAMPKDLWKIDRDGEHGLPSFRFQRPMCREDWDRPLLYSKFIKELIVDKHPGFWRDIQLDGDVIHSLTLSLTLLSSPLFNNLMMLHWGYDMAGGDQLDLIAMSIGPRLSYLTIHCPPRVSSSLLSTITAKSNALLSLHVVDFTPLQFVMFISAFPACQHLRDVKLHPFTVPVAIDLSLLPHLEELVVSCAPKDSARYTPTNLANNKIPSSGFPSLHSLTIQGYNNIEESFTLFDMLKDTPLENFRILLLRGSNLTPTISKLFSSLTPTRFSKSLKSFAIENCTSGLISTGAAEDGLPDFSYLVETLERLYEFPSLQCVEIITPSPYNVTNEQLATMASKWTDLCVLDLRQHDFRPGRVIPPRATLEGLKALAEGCPNLADVTMCIDATSVTPPARHLLPDTHEKESFKHVVSIFFSFPSSPIKDPDSVAAFIASTFWDAYVQPPTDDDGIEVDWPDEDKDGVQVGGWNVVYELLNGIHRGRKGR